MRVPGKGKPQLSILRNVDCVGRFALRRIPVSGGTCAADTWLRAHLDTKLRFVGADPMFRLEFGDDVVGRDLAGARRWSR